MIFISQTWKVFWPEKVRIWKNRVVSVTLLTFYVCFASPTT